MPQRNWNNFAFNMQEIADLYIKTFESLARAIKVNDPTTHGHLRQAQMYATELDKLLKLPETKIEALISGILNLPSLTEDIVLCHHEQQDTQKLISSQVADKVANAQPATNSASGLAGAFSDDAASRSLTEAQREVFALDEIAQVIGSSLNLQDTVILITDKLRATIPFDTCVIYILNEKTGGIIPVHVAGDHADAFSEVRIKAGCGIIGRAIADARSVLSATPEKNLVDISEEISGKVHSALVYPLIREDGAFGAIALYSKTRASYAAEHVRLLESIAQYASSALDNALTFEKTKQRALFDSLTDLPNARAFYMMLEQRIAECQRMKHESLIVLSMDIDDFRKVNDIFGHAIGDRALATVAGVIKKELRQMDTLARYAGDEFVAIIPMASSETASIIVERIRSAVESHKFVIGIDVSADLCISIGFSCFPGDGETAEQLLNAATHNMRRDKHARQLDQTSANSSGAVLDLLR